MFNKRQKKKMYSWLDASRVSFGIKGDFFSKKKKKKKKLDVDPKRGLESTSYPPTKMLSQQLGGTDPNPIPDTM